MEQSMDKEILQLAQQVRAVRPLVHCITNIVTVNDCANILLAAGASPTMAHHPLEVEEIQAGCKSLVCNLGATESFDAMFLAAKEAARLGHPVILDPVGVSGSTFRREKCFELMKQAKVTCIRGNYSEIRALMHQEKTATGVDANDKEVETKDEFQLFCEEVMAFAKTWNCIVIASGKTDVVSDGKQLHLVKNGDSMMSKITGSGCMSSALLGAYLGSANEENYFMAAVASCTIMGICGERGAEKTKKKAGGTMTFHDCLIDEVSIN